MRFLSIVIMSLIASRSLASDPSWFCTEAASKRLGSEFQACGAGIGRDEEQARRNAYTSAWNEFVAVCNSTPVENYCLHHKYMTIPERNDCRMIPQKEIGVYGAYKCYRMVRFVFVN